MNYGLLYNYKINVHMCVVSLYYNNLFLFIKKKNKKKPVPQTKIPDFISLTRAYIY